MNQIELVVLPNETQLYSGKAIAGQDLIFEPFVYDPARVFVPPFPSLEPFGIKKFVSANAPSTGVNFYGMCYSIGLSRSLSTDISGVAYVKNEYGRSVEIPFSVGVVESVLPIRCSAIERIHIDTNPSGDGQTLTVRTRTQWDQTVSNRIEATSQWMTVDNHDTFGSSSISLLNYGNYDAHLSIDVTNYSISQLVTLNSMTQANPPEAFSYNVPFYSKELIIPPRDMVMISGGKSFSTNAAIAAFEMPAYSLSAFRIRTFLYDKDENPAPAGSISINILQQGLR